MKNDDNIIEPIHKNAAKRILGVTKLNSFILRIFAIQRIRRIKFSIHNKRILLKDKNVKDCVESKYIPGLINGLNAINIKTIPILTITLNDLSIMIDNVNVF